MFGCGGAGGGAFGGNTELAATYRTAFTRGAVADTVLLLFIGKDGHVGAQLNSSSDVLFAGTGTLVGNNLVISMQSVNGGGGTVLAQGSVLPGDPPTIAITLSGAISANVSATEFAGADVVLSAGTYNGTLEDGDTGTFTITVTDSGDVTGTVNSSLNGDNLPVEGSTDLKGEIHFHYHVAGGDGTFEGYLFMPVNTTEFVGEGDWDFGEVGGDWQASKPSV